MGRPEFDKGTGARAAEVIRERIDALNVTVAELARRAKFDGSQMNKIALGRCGTDLDGWKRIAIALELTPAAFFARVFPGTPPGGRRTVRRSAGQAARDLTKTP